MAKNNIQYAIEMQNITKIFLETIVANDNISFQVKKGEIHALVGENGAGKSTLMSMLFGLYQPTTGIIKINGKQVIINSTIKAKALKIGMVHQHFHLVENFTILQNIMLGSEPIKKWQWLNYKAAKTKILVIAKKYNLDVNLDLKIADATVGMQQRVEILKVLYRGADIIVFDEPTAVLTPQEILGLLTVIKNLQKSGKTIIFISHKLEEVKKIAETITVIRSGKVVASFATASKKIAEIASLMVGKEIVTIKNNHKIPLGETILKINNLTINKTNKHAGLYNIDLDIKAGEIVAIAGIEGNGQTELVYSLTGLMKVNKGKIYLKQQNITNYTAKKLFNLGLSHIPEDRHKHGIVLDYNVIDNMVLQNVEKYPFSKWGLLRKKTIQNYAQKIIKQYDVRGSNNGFALMSNLSGGNQQKAVVGRELTRKHQLLVVVQPTRGLDIGAIAYIHKCILAEKAKNNAILLVSYELSEVMALADRIVVLHNGKITGNVLVENVKRETLGLMMTGKNWTKSEEKDK